MLEHLLFQRGWHCFSWPTCVLIVLLPCGVPSTSFGEQPAGDLAQHFQDEAPRRWREYRSWAEGLDGTAMVLKTTGDKQIVHAHSEYKHNSRCRMSIEKDLLSDSQKKPEGRVYAYNAAYSFTLRRQTADSAWVVTQVERRADGAASAAVQNLDAKNLAPVAISLLTIELLDLVQLPTFHVLRATAINREGEELARVEFDNTHPLDEPGRNFCAVQSGILLLDPSRFWCLRSCNLRCKFGDGNAVIKMENELVGPSAKHPFLKRQVTNIDLDSPLQGHVTQQFATDFDLHEPSRLPPDDDFTLTAFGLPEPFDVPKKSIWTRWYLWTGIGGVLCLIAGLVVQRFRRRQAT